MKSLSQYFQVQNQPTRQLGVGFITLALIAFVFLIASCVPSTSTPIISPKLGAALAQLDKGEQIVAEPTPTPVLIATLKPEQIMAGVPADVVALKGDPAKGPALASANGCKGCHSLDPNANPKPTGPTWFHLGDTAGNMVPGQSPGLYIYTSITNPSAFVVPDYPDNVMPKTFAQSLSKQDLADLMAYILSQHQ
ncbi:hypothetical protein BH10CHL1_BH10CHL1_22120 [soil metagenome]